MARAAIEKLKAAFEPYTDIHYEVARTVLDNVVRGYGGDPRKSRQRLDDLPGSGPSDSTQCANCGKFFPTRFRYCLYCDHDVKEASK